ncbi:MAG: steroid 3-ketoacyl-CoA thiolase [Solirubrobacteraceae bacterium]
MRSAVLIDAVRTPIGKRGGRLSVRHAADVLGHVQRAVLDRAGVEPEAVGQLVGGCVTQVGEQSFNTTRMAWLQAGLPLAIGASTLDCICGSSQQANHMISDMIVAGSIDAGVACGVEMMSRVQLGANTRGPGRPRPPGFPYDMPSQFVGAERIAAKHGITRDEADAFGERSQARARQAAAEGRLAEEIVPIELPADGSDDRAAAFAADEGIRPTTLSGLRALPPILQDGIHTAGSTSQISDGAAAALWMEAGAARARGLAPRARIRRHVLVGADPYFHVEGPVDATRELLAQAGMTIADIDLFEINEAFASVVLAWQRAFDVEPDRLNVNGGAIALGHPMGATGMRLLATAVAELERRDKEIALVAMCCGGAVATGTIIERV